MARLSERHGDPRTAEQIYLAVLKKNPQNQLAHHRLGVLSAKAREHDKAGRISECGPPSWDRPRPNCSTNRVQSVHDGRVPEAEAAIRQAIEIDPQNRSARNNLGLVLGETSRYGESLAEFRRAGGEAEAQANLAYAQTRAGDLAGAKSSYHRALSLNKELKPAAEALVQLASSPRRPSIPTGPRRSPAVPAPPDSPIIAHCRGPECRVPIPSGTGTTRQDRPIPGIGY